MSPGALTNGASCSGNDVNDLVSELQRRKGISDQMLTIHSVLRDRYVRKAKLFDLIVFAVATLLVATTFLDPAIVRYLAFDPERVRLVTGVLSIGLFFLSVAALLLEWKERATKHQQACRTLADVKAKSRELLSGAPERVQEEGAEFLRGSAFAMSELHPIPDREFNSLKVRHKRKVQLSRMADQFPSAPLWVLRLRSILFT